MFFDGTMRQRRRRALGALLGGALVVALAPISPAAATLSPSSATFTVSPGGTVTETKTVEVPATPAKADIEIAIDTTGSMFGAIAQAKAQATQLVNDVKAEIADAQFAVVDFRDSTDGAAEYIVRTPMTGSAANVQAAINAMSAGGGGDFPEAYNLVYNRAHSPATDGPIGWRAGSRKFLVVIGDAPPHGAVPAGYPACFDSSADPHGLNTKTELTKLAAAQRTLFMVAVGGIKSCYDQLVVGGFSGSASVQMGASISTQIVNLIKSASSTVNDVHLEVASAAPAPANASWISFSPAKAGPLTTPATVNFALTATVPPGTPGGSYVFDIVALADGADVGHQTLTLNVPDVRVSINDVSVNEGDAGTTPATFTVSLSQPAPPGGITVLASTANQTATAPSDYQAQANALVSFAAGETSKPFTVQVVGDLVNEPDETFVVNLGSPTNATIADGQGVGTIVDDERDGAFSCRASALRVTGLVNAEQAVANPGNSPCVDDAKSVLTATHTSGSVNVSSRTLNASTDQTPDNLEPTAPAATDNAVATASVERATVSTSLVTVNAVGVQSQARVQCTAGPGGLVPAFTSSSTIASLTINGIAVNVNGSGTINLPLGLGTVQLNQTSTTANSITQTAIRIVIDGQTVVIGEARANFSGNPCSQ